MGESRHTSNDKNIWVADLLVNGLVPRMDIIDQCRSEDAFSCEEGWIDYYRKQGFDLLNTDYGSNTGATKFRHSGEFKRDRDRYTRPKLQTAKEAHNAVFNSQDLSPELKKREEELKSFKLSFKGRKKDAPKSVDKSLADYHKYIIINFQIQPQKCS